MGETKLKHNKINIILIYAKWLFSAQIVSRETLFFETQKIQWTKKIYSEFYSFIIVLKTAKLPIKSSLLGFQKSKIFQNCFI